MDYPTIAGNRPDPRVRLPQLEVLRQAFTTVADTGRGTVIFLAGFPGSGRTATLRAFRKWVKAETRARVVAAAFQQGIYRPVDVHPGQHREVLGLLGEWLAVPALFTDPILPVLGLVAQLLQAGAVTEAFVRQRLAAEPAARRDPARLLKMTLRQAAADRPVVCFLDPMDADAAEFLRNILLLSARELLDDRPILIVAALDGPAELDSVEESDTGPLYVARRLVEQGWGHWLPLRPMTEGAIGAWLRNAQPELVHHLHRVTGGNPDWLALLWEELWRRELVQPHPDTYRWQAAPGFDLAGADVVHDNLIERLQSLLADTDFALEEVLEWLAIAGLEGPAFTANALARFLDWDEDDLIDFLDDSLLWAEERPYGILEEVGSVEIHDAETSRYVWRYRFVSALLRYTLLRYHLDATQQTVHSRRLAQALEEVYGTEVRVVADILARLYREAGDAGRARHYSTMAYHRDRVAALRLQAQIIMQTDRSSWDAWDYAWAAGRLNDAAWAMYRVYPFREMLDVAQAAHEFAQAGRARGQEARSLNHQGLAWTGLGELQQALTHLEQALAIWEQLGDQQGIAATLHQMAYIYTVRGDLEEAMRLYRQSLSIKEQLGDQQDKAATLHQMAHIYTVRGDLEEAMRLYRQALAIWEQLGDRQGKAATLHAMAYIYRVRGELEEAMRLYRQSLSIKEPLGNQKGKAATLTMLGQLLAASGQSEEGIQMLQEALAIFRRLGMPREIVQVQEILDQVAGGA